VARDAEPPKQGHKEYTTLSREQLTAFFATAVEAEDRFQAFFVAAALTGLRPGELLGLKWQDLRLPKGRRGGGGYGTPQSVYDAGGPGVPRDDEDRQRSSGLPAPPVVGALRAHHKRQLEERVRYAGLREDHDLVFGSKTGTR
jgi:integrase